MTIFALTNALGCKVVIVEKENTVALKVAVFCKKSHIVLILC